MKNVNFIRYTMCASIILCLSACATPFSPPTIYGNETTASCVELEQMMQEAVQHKQAAIDESGFRSSYILILPDIISMIRIYEAEEAANKRIFYLDSVLTKRGCQYDKNDWRYQFHDRRIPPASQWF